MKGKVNVKSLSRVRLLATPWTAAYQAPLSMGFSRQEYWSRLPWSIKQWELTQRKPLEYKTWHHPATLCRMPHSKQAHCRWAIVKKKVVIATSKLTNHRLHIKYNNNEKVWNTVRITKIWHRDMKWAETVGKMVPRDLLVPELSQSSNLWKKKKKCNTYETKWITMKRALPVNITVVELKE